MTDWLGNDNGYGARLPEGMNPLKPAAVEQNAYGPYGMSWIFRPLDLLGHTVRATIHAAITGDVTPLWENFKFWDPLTESEFVSGRQVLTDLGFGKYDGYVDLPILGKSDLAGFLTEIVTDPLTYLTFTPTKVGEAAAAESMRLASNGLSPILREAAFNPKIGKIVEAGSALMPESRAWHLLKEFGDDGLDKLSQYIYNGIKNTPSGQSEEASLIMSAFLDYFGQGDDLLRKFKPGDPLYDIAKQSLETNGTIADKYGQKVAEIVEDYVRRFDNQFMEDGTTLIRDGMTPKQRALGAQFSYLVDEHAHGRLPTGLDIGSIGSFLRGIADEPGFTPSFMALKDAAYMMDDMGGRNYGEMIKRGLHTGIGIELPFTKGEVRYTPFKNAQSKFFGMALDNKFMRRWRNWWASLWTKRGVNESLQQIQNIRHGLEMKYGQEYQAIGEGVWNRMIKGAEKLGLKDAEGAARIATSLVDVVPTVNDVANEARKMGFDFDTGIAIGELLSKSDEFKPAFEAARDNTTRNILKLTHPNLADNEIESIVALSRNARNETEMFLENMHEQTAKLLGIEHPELARKQPEIINERLAEMGIDKKYYVPLNAELIERYREAENILKKQDEVVAGAWKEAEASKNKIEEDVARKISKVDFTPADKYGADVIGDLDIKAPDASIIINGHEESLIGRTRQEIDELERHEKELRQRIMEALDKTDDPQDTFNISSKLITISDNINAINKMQDYMDKVDNAAREAFIPKTGGKRAAPTFTPSEFINDVFDADTASRFIEDLQVKYEGVFNADEIYAFARSIDLEGFAALPRHRQLDYIATHIFLNGLLPSTSPRSGNEIMEMFHERIGDWFGNNISNFLKTGVPSHIVALEDGKEYPTILRALTEVMDDMINEFGAEEIYNNLGTFFNYLYRSTNHLDQELIANGVTYTAEARNYVKDVARGLRDFIDERLYKSITASIDKAIEDGAEYDFFKALQQFASSEQAMMLGKLQTYFPHQITPEVMDLFLNIAGGEYIGRLIDKTNFTRRFRTGSGLAMSMAEVNALMGDLSDYILRAGDIKHPELINQLDYALSRIPRINLADTPSEVIDEMLVLSHTIPSKIGYDQLPSKYAEQMVQEINSKFGVNTIDMDIAMAFLQRGDKTGGYAAYYAPMVLPTIYDNPELKRLMDDYGVDYAVKLNDLDFWVAKGKFTREEVETLLATAKHVKDADGAIYLIPEGHERILIPGFKERFITAPAEVAEDMNSNLGAKWLFNQLAPSGQEIRLQEWLSNPEEAYNVFLNGYKKIVGKKSLSFFEENPGIALIKYAMQKNEVTISAIVDENIKQLFGKMEKFAPMGYQSTLNPAYKGYKFSPAVAHALDLQYQAAHDQNVISVFRRTFNRITKYVKTGNFWMKQFTTRFWPSYWTRNFVSDNWQSFLGGGFDFKSRIVAGEIQKHHLDFINALKNGEDINKAREALYDSLRKITYHDRNGEQIYEAAMRQNIFFSGEYYSGMMGYGERGQAAFLGKYSDSKIDKTKAVAGEKFANFANYMEGMPRLAHFMKRMKEGDTEVLAAESVRQFLFDFGDVGVFDEKVEPYLWFWRWTRKNMSLGTHIMLTNPKVFSWMGKMVQSSYRGDVPQDKLPKWLVGTSIRIEDDGVYFNGGKNTRYINLQGFIPQVELLGYGQYFDNGIVGGISKYGLDRLVPFVKVPMELGLNKNLYMDMPIQRFEGETKESIIGRQSATNYYLSNQFRQMAFFNKVYRAGERGEATFPIVLSDMAFGFKVMHGRPETTGYYHRGRLKSEYSAAKRAFNRAKKKQDIAEMQRLQPILMEYKARIDALPKHFPGSNQQSAPRGVGR